MSQTAIEPGARVWLRYTLHDSEGQLIEEVRGEGQVYVHGQGGVVPGLERALSGHAAGDTVDVTLDPVDAYGERDTSVGPQPVPRATFPEDVRLRAGMSFAAETPDGEPITLYIVDVQPDVVLIDKNHPLAGRSLRYRVEVVRVERPAN